MLFGLHIKQRSIKLVIFSEINLKVWIQTLLIECLKGKPKKKNMMWKCLLTAIIAFVHWYQSKQLK